jgi:hypothetical protein
MRRRLHDSPNCLKDPPLSLFQIIRDDDPVRFIDEVLRDPETEKPFVLLDAEKSFISHVHAVSAPLAG